MGLALTATGMALSTKSEAVKSDSPRKTLICLSLEFALLLDSGSSDASILDISNGSSSRRSLAGVVETRKPSEDVCLSPRDYRNLRLERSSLRGIHDLLPRAEQSVWRFTGGRRDGLRAKNDLHRPEP
jgi:hypothetical protein